MVTRQELDEAIRECEAAPPSYDVCRKLAVFYTVQEHLYGKDEIQVSGDMKPELQCRTAAEEMIGYHGDSEFLQLIAGRESDAVWAVLDELMETLAIVNPRLYDGVMRRINGIL